MQMISRTRIACLNPRRRLDRIVADRFRALDLIRGSGDPRASSASLLALVGLHPDTA
jgi:hypothetical protein